MVPQIDEQQPAVIALAMNPARQADTCASIGDAQGTAIMGTISVHLCYFHGFFEARKGA